MELIPNIKQFPYKFTHTCIRKSKNFKRKEKFAAQGANYSSQEATITYPEKCSELASQSVETNKKKSVEWLSIELVT